MSKLTAQEWNDTYAVGVPVYVTEDDGSITATQTRTKAWSLGHGEVIVSVKGRPGGYKLDRMEVR